MAAPILISQVAATGDKSQVVRLMDVFVFGPLMIQASRSQRGKYFRTALFLIGLGTILYNGANYLTTRASEKEAAQLEGLGQRIAPHPGRMYQRRSASH